MADGDVKRTSVVLHMKDAGGQPGRLVLTGTAPTVALAKTFAAAQSSCAITGASIVNEVECAAVAGAGTKKDNIDRKLIVSYKNTTQTKKGRFVIPGYSAPDESFTAGEKGERLTKAAGDAIVAAYKTATANADTLVFTRGTPVQRV